MTRDDLERALAEQFDAENLSVYGDYLQSIGDPRGELIALDLNERDEPERRSELIAEWLGPSARALAQVATIEHGFFTDLYLDGDDPQVARWLALIHASELYLRGVTIRGGGGWVERAVEQLARGRHAWLTRLSIQATDEQPPALTGERAAALTRATPRLEHLEVWGRFVFGELAHDHVRSLCVTGWDALGSLLGAGAAQLPAVTVLDLAFHVEHSRAAADLVPLHRMLPPGRLPKLRRLDLSRNEPGARAPHYLGGVLDPFGFLAEAAISRQLTHVRLPSVRSSHQAEQLTAAVARMPALRELAVVRSYRGHHVTLPPVARLAEAWPWPSADRAAPQLTASVDLHAPTSGPFETAFELALPPLIRWLEHHIAGLSFVARTSWLGMFEQLYLHDSAQLPRAATLSALEVLDDADELADWIALRELIVRAVPHGSVRFATRP